MKITYRGNLASQSFPFLSTQQPLTVIYGAQDQAFTRSYVEKNIPDRDLNVAQAYYVENCLPTVQGFLSVGFDKVTNFITDLGAFQAFQVDLPSGEVGYLINTILGLYLATESSSDWVGFLVKTSPSSRISVCKCQGVTYICVANEGVWKINSSNIAEAVTLTGLDMTTIIFLSSYSGYLLASQEDSFLWSSVTDPTDFTPSLATGSGGGTVEAAKGNITGLYPTASGVFISCEFNIVYAAYSNNDRYPFVLREIPDVGGVASSDQAAYSDLSDQLYVYTSSGLQSVTPSAGGQQVFPEATDFLQTGILEYYDFITGKVLSTQSSSPLVVKLTQVADRYIVISFGETTSNMSGSIVYDTAIKKWGRIVYPHVVCFSGHVVGDKTNAVLSQFSFMDTTGEISVLNPHAASVNGVVLLGKFNYVRQKFLRLSKAIFTKATSLRVKCFSEFLNLTQISKDLTKISSVEGDYIFGEGYDGYYLSLSCVGEFELNSFVLELLVTGDAI